MWTLWGGVPYLQQWHVVRVRPLCPARRSRLHAGSDAGVRWGGDRDVLLELHLGCLHRGDLHECYGVLRQRNDRDDLVWNVRDGDAHLQRWHMVRVLHVQSACGRGVHAGRHPNMQWRDADVLFELYLGGVHRCRLHGRLNLVC
jgi:hypothetical protein